jgi:hypothetical protein
VWEPLVLAAGYQFCLFDGLSRFYVADEHRELAPLLSYPACVFDQFETLHDREVADRIATLELELVDAGGQLAAAEHERATSAETAATAQSALQQLTNEVTALRDEVTNLRADYAAVRTTLSWRLTAPLRAVRRRTRDS